LDIKKEELGIKKVGLKILEIVTEN